jgi:hypothetical protein
LRRRHLARSAWGSGVHWRPSNPRVPGRVQGTACPRGLLLLLLLLREVRCRGTRPGGAEAWDPQCPQGRGGAGKASTWYRIVPVLIKVRHLFAMLAAPEARLARDKALQPKAPQSSHGARARTHLRIARARTQPIEGARPLGKAAATGARADTRKGGGRKRGQEGHGPQSKGPRA